MSGPFAEGGIVMEFETGSPDQFLQFEPGPSHLPPGVWLHRRGEFDPSASREAIVNEYALPESDTYTIRIIEVPPGEQMRMGDLAGAATRQGGADLVELRSRDSIPEQWVREEMTLGNLLE